MIDIAREEIYIRGLRRVIAASLTYRVKPYVKNGRECDGFVYVLEGGCTYRFRDGTHFTAAPGDILYLAAGAHYTMRLLPGTYGYIFCDFDFDDPRERESCRAASLSPGETEARFRRLLRAYRQFRKNGFTDSLSQLYQIYGDLRAAAEGAYVGRQARDRIETSRRIIEENYADPDLSVRSLAEKAGMSEVYFRKLFHALYGDSPSGYLISVRLRAAEELLQYSSLSLRECAAQCGFSSVQYFCRVFKKKRGVTPSRWRKENRERAT